MEIIFKIKVETEPGECVVKIQAEPKFKKGQWVRYKPNGNPYVVAEYMDRSYRVEVADGDGLWFYEHNLEPYTPEEGEYFWVSREPRSAICIARKGKQISSNHCAYFIGSERLYDKGIFCLNEEIKTIRPATSLEMIELDGVLFAAGKVWDGKQLIELPKFKDGDYITIEANTGVLIGILNENLRESNEMFPVYAGLNLDKELGINVTYGFLRGNKIRYATLEEIKQLNNALAEKCQKWDKDRKQIVGLNISEATYVMEVMIHKINLKKERKSPKDPIKGEKAIFWNDVKAEAITAVFVGRWGGSYASNGEYAYKNAILYESMEQYDEFLKEF
jgi:hypothetical protein